MTLLMMAARRAHFGFGMKIVVQSRSKVDPVILAETEAAQVDTVEQLLPECGLMWFCVASLPRWCREQASYQCGSFGFNEADYNSGKYSPR